MREVKFSQEHLTALINQCPRETTKFYRAFWKYIATDKRSTLVLGPRVVERQSEHKATVRAARARNEGMKTTLPMISTQTLERTCLTSAIFLDREDSYF